MSIFSSSKIVSRRSLTFNKSFFISLIIHLLLIFGISITTYYKLPIFKESPIINVKFANSNQDLYSKINIGGNETLKKNLQTSFDGNMIVSQGASQSFRIKKLQANSVVNSDEAIYLNLWQRQIETTGDDIISKSKNLFDGKVQIMTTIDIYGNLISSKILISSGDKFIDEMALNILNESAPFAPFNQTMSSEYSILEIIRDWNFSSN